MFWKSKARKTMNIYRPTIAKRVLWDVNLKYEDGSEKTYKNALSVYPVGDCGTHLRIEFDGPGFQSSFVIVSLSKVSQVEGQRHEEETEPEQPSIP